MDHVAWLRAQQKIFKASGSKDRTPDNIADELERLRELVRCLVENDPNDYAADAVTVLDVWRKDARKALGLD